MRLNPGGNCRREKLFEGFLPRFFGMGLVGRFERLSPVLIEEAWRLQGLSLEEWARDSWIGRCGIAEAEMDRERNARMSVVAIFILELLRRQSVS